MMKIFSLKRISFFILVLSGFGYAVLFLLPNIVAYENKTKHGPFYPRIIDGDTIANEQSIFRIVGIDTCEMGQPIKFREYNGPLDCGLYAKQVLTNFISNNNVVCFDEGIMSYGRWIARCFIETPSKTYTIDEDIGAFMIKSGWALPYHNEGFTSSRYTMEYLLALLARNGIHNGSYTNPAIWRVEN